MCHASSLLDLVDPVTTLVAAFAGAWFAFLFERRQRGQEETARRVAAANKALYTSFNIWNVQEQLRKEVIDPFRKRPAAWLNMPATVPARYGITNYDAEPLSFLLGKEAEIYSKLLLEEQRIDLVIKMIEARSRLVFGVVFPRMAAAGFSLNESIPLQTIENALGVDVVQQLRVLTDGIMKNIDENLVSIVAMFEELRAAMLRIDPDAKLIKVDFTRQPEEGVENAV